MPGESGVTAVTMLVCSIIFARETAGATRARHFLRPHFEASGFAQLGRIALRERGGVGISQRHSPMRDCAVR
jgi:hypothetical protein